MSHTIDPFVVSPEMLCVAHTAMFCLDDVKRQHESEFAGNRRTCICNMLQQFTTVNLVWWLYIYAIHHPANLCQSAEAATVDTRVAKPQASDAPNHTPPRSSSH